MFDLYNNLFIPYFIMLSGQCVSLTCFTSKVQAQFCSRNEPSYEEKSKVTILLVWAQACRRFTSENNTCIRKVFYLQTNLQSSAAKDELIADMF